MIRNSTKSTRFFNDNYPGFYVDCEPAAGYTEYWLGHKDYGIRILAFAVCETDNYDAFAAVVFDDFLDFYRQKAM